MQCACAILPSVACPALQYFSTLSHKRHDFRGEKNSYWTQNVCFFSTIFVWNISHSGKTSARSRDKRTLVFMWSAVISVTFWWNLNFLAEEYSNNEFHENPSGGSRNVSCGRTDRQTWRSQESIFEIVRTRLKSYIYISYVQANGSPFFVSGPRSPGRHGALCRLHKGGTLNLRHQMKWDIYRVSQEERT